MASKQEAIDSILSGRVFRMGDWETVKAIAAEAYDAGKRDAEAPEEPLAYWETQLLEEAKSAPQEPSLGALPDRLDLEADVYLDWPDGTRVVDSDGDTYTRVRGHWEWTVYDDGTLRDTYGEDDGDYLATWLPARVIRVGKEDGA